MVLFFIMYIVGMLYSTDIDAASKALQNKIPFLIFPFFLPIIFSSSKQQNFSYLTTFALSGVVYVFLSLLRAVFVFFNEESTRALFSEDFYFRLHDSQIILHPTYGAVYFNLLFFVVCIFLVFNTQLFKNKNKGKLLAIAITSLVFVVLSLSKLGFLMFLINVMILLVFYATVKNKVKESIIVFLSFVIVTAGLVYTTPLKIRFEQAYHEIVNRNQNPDDYYMSTGTRLWTWKVTNEMIRENGFLGAGTGDFKNELEQKFRTKKMVDFYGYDSHQQYLQTTATIGYIGLLFLILMFVVIIVRAVKTKNVLLCFLALMYVLWGFTESMFERQSGVLFFIFFIFLIDNLHVNKPSVEE